MREEILYTSVCAVGVLGAYTKGHTQIIILAVYCVFLLYFISFLIYNYVLIKMWKNEKNK